MNNFIAHILVVDDDEGIRSLLKKYLNENNYIITTADSSENASEKIKIIKFDLIISRVIKSFSTLFRLCFVTFNFFSNSEIDIPSYMDSK